VVSEGSAVTTAAAGDDICAFLGKNVANHDGPGP
jgi:hypothetical protein